MSAVSLRPAVASEPANDPPALADLRARYRDGKAALLARFAAARPTARAALTLVRGLAGRGRGGPGQGGGGAHPTRFVERGAAKAGGGGLPADKVRTW